MEFTIKNCRIEISFLFFATLTFSLLCDRSGIAGIGVLAAILHESGHILLMNIFGIPPRKIKMNPFGIDIVEGDRAGPTANLLSFFALLAWFSVWPQRYLFFLSAANLGLFLFNILPIEPLDGGQALYSFLCLRFPEAQAAHITEVVSFFALFPLAAAGFLALFRSGYNFTLLLAAGYLAALLLLKKGRYF